MLGKLGTVFSYMSHFFLQSWPEYRPGILFLTDAEGRLVKVISLQVGQKWSPHSFPYQEGERMALDPASDMAKKIRSGQIVVDECRDEQEVLGALPLLETDGSLYAVIGLIVPKSEIDFDLASYLLGLDPLAKMAWDAYIHHATTEIVMNVNKFDSAQKLMQSLVEQIAEVIGKGICSSVMLTEDGHPLPHGRVTTEAREKSETHLAKLLPRLLHSRLKPSVLDDDRLVIFPIYCEERPLAALLLHLSPEDTHLKYDERDIAFLQEVGERSSYSVLRAVVADELRQEARKKDLLYQLTKKIQASIDVNEVLGEIMNSIHQFYPYMEAELFLTVETNTTLPVKSLTFQPGEAGTSTRAYLEGRLAIDRYENESEKTVVIAAPLLGKQGIYGALQLTAYGPIGISENEMTYITNLAETAGTAFENAQLYQQSRNLIRELRLINQMAQQLNRSLNLDEILQFVTKMLLETFEAQYCAILQKLPESDQLKVLNSSDPQQNGMTLSVSQEPFADLFRSKQALILTHSEITPSEMLPYASLMGVPLLRESEVAGVVLVADERQHFFSFDDYKLLEIFAQHTSLAITNAILHNEMERMVITDNLTGLYSRRFLNERVQKSLESDSFGSLILIDIDYFKKVNDTFGHQVGDEVLVQVSNLIRRSIRESDIAARWGGEELAIYLPRVDIPTSLTIAERIRTCVEAETVPAVTISCGLAKWDRVRNQNMSVEMLFHDADIALYEAKHRGRNQVRLA